MSLWRGLNWDTDLNKKNDSASSPGPPATKALLQSCMLGSYLEISLSGDFLGSSMGRLLLAIDLSPSSRHKWDSPWDHFGQS